jgi:hypothetical protein
MIELDEPLLTASRDIHKPDLGSGHADHLNDDSLVTVQRLSCSFFRSSSRIITAAVLNAYEACEAQSCSRSLRGPPSFSSTS